MQELLSLSVNKSGMKIISHTDDTCLLELTRDEWESFGQQQRWLDPATPASKQGIDESCSMLPSESYMEATIRPDAGGQWAVDIEGERGKQQLAVCVDQKSAVAVKALLDELVCRIFRGECKREILRKELTGLREHCQMLAKR